MDAPVSGSKGPAAAGEMLILASGPVAAADTDSPVFDVIGRKTVWLGEAGRGSQVKLVVNAYMSVLIEGCGRRARPARRQCRPPGFARSGRGSPPQVVGADDAEVAERGAVAHRIGSRLSPA